MFACVLNSLPSNTATLSHVEGHQDSNKPFHHDLSSWPTQLNVTADKEAARYILPQPPPIMPVLPSNQMRLLDSHHRASTKHWNYHLRTKITQRPTLHGFVLSLSGLGLFFLTSISRDSIPQHGSFLPWYNGLWSSGPIRHFFPSAVVACITTIYLLHQLANAVQARLKMTFTYCVALCSCDVMLAPQHLSTFNTSYSYYTRNLRFKCLFYLFYTSVWTFYPAPRAMPSTSVSSNQLLIGQLSFLKGCWTKSFRSEQDQFYRSQHQPMSARQWGPLDTTCSVLDFLHYT